MVTSANTIYFPLLQDMVASLREHPGGRDIAVGCLDLGLEQGQKDWLASRSVFCVVPEAHFGSSGDPVSQHFLGMTERPFIREYFPGFTTYVWLDADVWLQSWAAMDALISGATEKGLAIVHESEKAYRFQAWLFAWTVKHFLTGYGPLKGAWLLTRSHLSDGVFAMRNDALHWEVWVECYRRAIARSGRVMPHDQFALNGAVYSQQLPATFLSANFNWICDRGIPMWNEDERKFCEPYPPYRAISVLHLAGPAKHKSYRVRTTSGKEMEVNFRYRMRPDAQ